MANPRKPWLTSGRHCVWHAYWLRLVEVLWPALTGLGEPPVLIPAIGNELLRRRAEARHYKQGLAWGRDPWPRISGLPLPVWERERWQRKVLQLKKCEVG